jgi:serine/threonine protein kinase
MSSGQIVAGQQYKWRLLEKLGEGDAGEVFRVESLLGGMPAILKRPRKSSFSSDVLRQAAQIKTEGKLLAALSGITGAGWSVPPLLDQSTALEGLGDSFFIVLEQAPGFDLTTLSRLARSGNIDEALTATNSENAYFLQQIAHVGKIPDPILLRSMLTLVDMLDTIHRVEACDDGIQQHGILWNDVKPEHLYWDPARAKLTIIDWGNGFFLESDGTTRDRRHSSADDYFQLIQAMGIFLIDNSPELRAQLDWPEAATSATIYADVVQPLKDRLQSLWNEAISQLQGLRNSAASLYGTTRPTQADLVQSDDIQRRFVTFGELPDFSSAINLYSRVALNLATANDLSGFRQLCMQTAKLPASQAGKWELLAEIAQIALLQPAPDQKSFSSALVAAIADDWPGLLWELQHGLRQDSLPDWWEGVSQGVRRVHLGTCEDTITPYLAVSRLFYTLQSLILRMGDTDAGAPAVIESLPAHEEFLRIFENEVLKKWKDLEPAPPHAGIAYDDIDELIGEIEQILPGTQDKLNAVLEQPRAQAQIALDAWERRDFDKARQALRRLLLWDPYRRRLSSADKAIASASHWLSGVRKGAHPDEPFYDYLTSIELAGRDLRNRVGQAGWLSLILDALKRLRKGVRPADLIMDHPEVLDEIPWLYEFRSREILALPRTRALTLERDNTPVTRAVPISGVVEGRLDLDMDLLLAEPLDTWVSEAHGSSARVFKGYLRDRLGKPWAHAIKIMRPERVEYALPLFKEEARVLSLLRDVPGVTPVVEYGFLRFQDGLSLPGDESHASADGLRGDLLRYGIEEVQNFLVSMERQLASGWLPYLALVLRNQEYNLIKYCDAGYTHGWFLPLRESLLLAIQICEILQVVHERNIVYRDHKILHYYWDPTAHGIAMIDWNISKHLPHGLSAAEEQLDLVQFGARALHHILTGRPAPGALPMGPNQPEEIERSAMSYTVNWTYDDERLPMRVKEILEGVLSQGYPHIKELRADLLQVYQQLPEQAQDAPVS